VRYIDPTGHWYYDPGFDCMVDNSELERQYPENFTAEINENEDGYLLPKRHLWDDNWPKRQSISRTAIFDAIGQGRSLHGAVSGAKSLYSITKPFIPNPIGEAAIGATLRATEDLVLGREQTGKEAVARALVVGIEDATVDFAATTAGLLVASEGIMCGPAAPGCMIAGYLTGTYGTDLVLSRVFDIVNDTWIFPGFEARFE
jgi:hypothetical protein